MPWAKTICIALCATTLLGTGCLQAHLKKVAELRKQSAGYVTIHETPEGIIVVVIPQLKQMSLAATVFPDYASLSESLQLPEATAIPEGGSPYSFMQFCTFEEKYKEGRAVFLVRLRAAAIEVCSKATCDPCLCASSEVQPIDPIPEPDS